MKDYKKILEGVVNIISTTKKSDIGFDNISAYIGENCPELRESEDEKIRKDLIEWIEEFPDMIWRTHYKKDVIAWLEKQGNEKPAIFVPKFREGDWIVQENIGVYKVIEICESWYEVVDGEDNHYSISFDKEYMCHLWDITKDAKGGDVLCTGNGNLFIFKERKDDVIYDYCGFYNNVFYTWSGSPNGTMVRSSYNDYKPATKEQHELLFQKMKEADYEWNDEKKELKKIEQNPAEDSCKNSDDIITEEKDSTDWSEEDKEHLNSIISDIKTDMGAYPRSQEVIDIYNDDISWLKSIKDRYTWKPSDEQMNALEFFVRSVGESGYASPYDNNTRLLQSLVGQLKKLKENKL